MSFLIYHFSFPSLTNAGILPPEGLVSPVFEGPLYRFHIYSFYFKMELCKQSKAVIIIPLKTITLGQSSQLFHPWLHFLAGEAISEVGSAEFDSIALPTESCLATHSIPLR